MRTAFGPFKFRPLQNCVYIYKGHPRIQKSIVVFAIFLDFWVLYYGLCEIRTSPSLGDKQFIYHQKKEKKWLKNNLGHKTLLMRL